jgi:hypothetical protein
MVEVDLGVVIASLRRHADVFAALANGVGDEQARWKPEPGKWSILEVVAHLADEEVEDFRARVDATLHRPHEDWNPIDPQGWAVERRYDDGTLPVALDRFLSARAESIAWLEGLSDPDWSLTHHHPKFGPIRAGDLLTAWVAHDHIHVRQLNRLAREFFVTRISGFSPAYAGTW